MADPELQKMTMAELAEVAHREGIPSVEHMSTEELIEAIEQQRETNDVLTAERRTSARQKGESKRGSHGSLPQGWENFPG
ncbi:Rho termination factor N-terminal domain-containing protein [Prauserella muralis]|uniref:Rho termination factor-like N-terminal domain-containing protein n=1 Tax=Prauserella muralis TaxID=588067 RepID=A0A2V4AZJ2_9PSEU|nr:Rho termination factor N-terminal domain-containing protein [Prauserella muralis]PXY27344.1 hypothetical protein BAY60_12940 [Prauserella muralis]TWE22973.1 Rho termination factor-like protein [Prauserella muralis]